MVESSSFGLVIAIVSMLIVILFLVMYLYPKIPEIANKGIESADSASIDAIKADLMVKDNDIDCDNNVVTVRNVGGTDAESISIYVTIGGALETRTVSLPEGSSIILSSFSNDFTGNLISVEIDPLNDIDEMDIDNNVADKNC